MEIVYCFVVTVLKIQLFRGSLSDMDMMEIIQPSYLISGET